MNEDYLWDKTGEDPEIEKLENALAVFRYKETAPPALPAKILSFKKKETPRSFIRYAFAAAACAAFVFASLAVWLQMSANESELAGEFAGNFKPRVEITAPIEPIDDETETIKPSAERKFVKIKKSVQPVSRPNKTLARNTKNVKTDELTEEEKYAYNQLMLALSITSSKLKLVSDKIEGTEKQNSVNTDGK